VARPQKKKRKKINWKVLLFLPVPLLWGWLAQTGRLNAEENLLLDWRFRQRGEIEAPVKVFYVDVDTKAVQAIGERPWNRFHFAEAAQLLFEEGKVKGVGFDFVFSALGHSDLVNKEEANKGNLVLARLARKHPELIFAAQYTGGDARTQFRNREFPLVRRGFTDREKNDVPELPQYPITGSTLTTSWGTIGLIDIDYDFGADPVPRWAPLFAESSTTNFWNLALQLVCVELGVPPGSARRNGDFVDIFDEKNVVLRHIPVTKQQLLEVNWFSRWDSQEFNPRSSMADVLKAGEQLKSDKDQERRQAQAYFKRFAGAIVLVGPVDPLLQDLAPTPFDSDPVPKVGGHGNLIKTIMAERYLQRLPNWGLWTCILVLTFVVTLLTSMGGARSLSTKILALILLTGYGASAIYVFAQIHLIVPMVAPLGAAFSTGFIATLWQLVQEEKHKGRIKSMFSTYLAPELVNQMVDSKTDPQLGGHEAVITAYFSDIQSFSTFSELMPASQLVDLMNEYLTACTDILQEEKGTLDKYIGDAVVAIFGAPLPVTDHAYRACVATQRVQRRIEELRKKWKSETSKWPEVVHVLRARRGLNTGSAIIGNMGSRTRFSYTMMGDNVNLAARMESGAKALGVFTMVTEATKLACEKHGGEHVVFRFLDKIVVKGRSRPVSVFEIVGLKEHVSAQTLECISLFSQGSARYLAQDWDEALRLFELSSPLEPNQPSKEMAIGSNPSVVMIERCHYMKLHSPGAGWNGVYEMKEK
jgi:adenylate cyclase